MDFTLLNNKQKNIYQAVEYLYKNSRRRMAHWFWDNHLIPVINSSHILTLKYKANSDYTFAGALLHDVADVWLERTDVLFESTSTRKAALILKKGGYLPKDIEIIREEVINPHSCRSGLAPHLLEGKILSTADALAHLCTHFYHSFKAMCLPEHVLPGNFNEWALSKIERDFMSKIAFEDERRESRGVYEKLKNEFGQ